MKKRPTLATFGVATNHQNQILLVQMNAPQNPAIHGKWNFPGGIVDFGETPEEALLREFEEETSLSPTIESKTPVVGSFINPNKTSHILLLCYKVSVDENTKPRADQLEVSDCKWFNLAELDNIPTLPLTKDLIGKSINTKG